MYTKIIFLTLYQSGYCFSWHSFVSSTSNHPFYSMQKSRVRHTVKDSKSGEWEGLGMKLHLAVFGTTGSLLYPATVSAGVLK